MAILATLKLLVVENAFWVCNGNSSPKGKKKKGLKEKKIVEEKVWKIYDVIKGVYSG